MLGLGISMGFRFTESCTGEDPVNNLFQLVNHVAGSCAFIEDPWHRREWWLEGVNLMRSGGLGWPIDE